MIEYKVLPSGVRLVMEKLPEFQSAAIGIWTGAGSACESPEISGISHFIEHMYFKGTKTRSAKKLAEDTDNLGASINAFTGKEATCYHIKALTEVFPQAVDILLDMICNSVFDEKEMNRERKVIIEEMKMYEDTPDDYAMDLLMEKVFTGTPLQSSVIGTRKSLKGINRDAIISYIDKYYKKDNIVVAVAGNFDENRLIEQLEEHLGTLGEKSLEKGSYGPSEVRKFGSYTKDISQSHITLGMPSISLADEAYYAQAVVCDVLGGSMSSRLFQSLREEKGLCYTVYSAPVNYTNTGLFFIYAGVTLGKEQETIDAIALELKKLADEGLTKDQVEIVKQRLKSGYIYGLESLNNRMQRLGKNRLLLNRNYSEKEVMDEIDAVTADQVNEFCRRIGDIDKYSAVIVSRDKFNTKKMLVK